jgi:hypothetical protein
MLSFASGIHSERDEVVGVVEEQEETATRHEVVVGASR